MRVKELIPWCKRNSWDPLKMCILLFNMEYTEFVLDPFLIQGFQAEANLTSLAQMTNDYTICVNIIFFFHLELKCILKDVDIT